MNESEIRGLIDQVRDNSVTRKQFIRQMVGVGLTVPMAAQMLLTSGLAQAQTASAYKPTKRGGGGALKLLWWQGATLLQPHFASGTKDQEGSRIFYEPLAAWDNDGNMVTILAAEVPSLANGGVSKDGKTITWKLKKNVQWHDGKPFTAKDVLCTWDLLRETGTDRLRINPRKAWYDNVDRISANGDFEVTFHLKRPQPHCPPP